MKKLIESFSNQKTTPTGKTPSSTAICQITIIFLTSQFRIVRPTNSLLKKINTIDSDGSNVRKIVKSKFSGGPVYRKSIIFIDNLPDDTPFYKVNLTADDAEPQKIGNVQESSMFLLSPIDDKVFTIKGDYSKTPYMNTFVVADFSSGSSKTVLSIDSSMNESFTPLSWSSKGNFIYMIKKVDAKEQLGKSGNHFNLRGVDLTENQSKNKEQNLLNKML